MHQNFAEIAGNAPGSVPLGINVAYQYLAKRGVERDLIDACGIKIVPASHLGRNEDSRLAIVFPHIDFTGRVQDWWSARMVESQSVQIVTSFRQLVAPKGKMLCPYGVPPCAYLPPLLDWGNIPKGTTIYIHESAIKAINGAVLGKYSIGLNGVWGWGSKKHKLKLIKEIERLPWKERELQCRVVFDSNVTTNTDVSAAVSALGQRIQTICGVHPTHVALPPREDGENWGFDDYRAELGDEAALAYLNQEAEPIEIAPFFVMRDEINSRCAVVKSLGRIVELDTGALMSRDQFTGVNYAAYCAEIDGKSVNVAQSWLKWSGRREVGTVAYEPGRAQITEEGNYNRWAGMGLEPAKGDVSPWLELISRNLKPSMARWLIQWFAYPLQNPGAKMTTYLLLFGPSGTGKDALLIPIKAIYGSNNCITINASRLENQFNAMFGCSQFVHISELPKYSSKFAEAHCKLKDLTTSATQVIERKGVDAYSVANVLNMALTSNYLDCIKLDTDDRRATIFRWGNQDKRQDQGYWMAFFNWANSEAGAAALYDYLLGVDLEGFDPNGWAPTTPDRADVIDATKNEIELWVAALVDSPDSILGNLGRPRSLYSCTDLLAIYNDTAAYPSNVVVLGKCLANEGIEKVSQVTFKSGARPKLWDVRRRHKHWTAEMIRKDYEG